MATVQKLHLTPRKRALLEEGANQEYLDKYRMRCQMVLLKAEGLTNKEIAEKVGCNPVTVSNWIKRYIAYGIKGLAEDIWVWTKG